MRKMYLLVFALICFSGIVHASNDAGFTGKLPRGDNVVRKLVANFDACMNEYNQGAALNELWYTYAIAFCYEVYQFPYNTQCHSQAILSWSAEQNYLFDQLVICQNGNPAKPQKQDAK